jgi:RimJ/RimL family protein N-acetyltransferase
METARLLLREWREEDIEPLARIYANPEVMKYMPPMSHVATERQIDHFQESYQVEGVPMWAAVEKVSGRLIGRVGLARHADWPYADNTEVGWLLDRPYWGRGRATEGAVAALEYGFSQLGLSRIISITRPDNLASRRVMAKVGLTIQGTQSWRGFEQVWYALDSD